MVSSEQTPPVSGQAPPSSEQILSAPEQASTASEQALPTSDTSRDVDLTYKLVLQTIDGAQPTQCSNPEDHISIRTDTTNTVYPPITDTDRVFCRSHCSWAGYHGDGSVIYNRREDQLNFGRSNGLIFQLGHGVYGAVVETSIMEFTCWTHYPGGRNEMHEGQYLQMYVAFAAAAAGSPAHSAIVIGKRLVGNETLGTVTLSEEELPRLLGKGENPWTRQPDN